MHHALEGLSAWKNAFSESFGSPMKATHSAGAEPAGRKPWPCEVYDGERIQALENTLGETLSPHLKVEEGSLKPASLQAAGWTREESASILMWRLIMSGIALRLGIL